MDIIYILGSLTLFMIIATIIGMACLAFLIFFSLRTGRVAFPSLMALLTSAFESPVKATFRFLNIDDTLVDQASINLRNRLFERSFSRIDFKQRMLFMPQCLRNRNCPARLTADGIKCIECGQCVISTLKKKAEGLGYKVFVVPGGSFIRRIARENKPGAILGIACRPEVKEGLDICERFKIPGQGIVLQRAGCIDTIVDVDEACAVIEKKVNG